MTYPKMAAASPPTMLQTSLGDTRSDPVWRNLVQDTYIVLVDLDLLDHRPDYLSPSSPIGVIQAAIHCVSEVLQAADYHA